jgi:molybdopterin synthase catalytic subunit/molybdopterin converting factor small subunit
MQIAVMYLGATREISGCNQETIELPDAANLLDLQKIIIEKYPQIGKHKKSLRWAQNFEFANDDNTLQEGDEIALIPPVAGGAPCAHVSSQELSLTNVIKKVQNDSHGALVLFLGTVRSTAQGKTVKNLSYEAYEPMATRELDRIACACTKKYATKTYIAHRSGHLNIGDIAVIIAAASPHRDAAFTACKKALETLKTDVPIWKKEFYDDGECWIGWGGG